jgi:hypothetical protein
MSLQFVTPHKRSNKLMPAPDPRHGGNLQYREKIDLTIGQFPAGSMDRRFRHQVRKRDSESRETQRWRPASLSSRTQRRNRSVPSPNAQLKSSMKAITEREEPPEHSAESLQVYRLPKDQEAMAARNVARGVNRPTSSSSSGNGMSQVSHQCGCNPVPKKSASEELAIAIATQAADVPFGFQSANHPPTKSSHLYETPIPRILLSVLIAPPLRAIVKSSGFQPLNESCHAALECGLLLSRCQVTHDLPAQGRAHVSECHLRSRGVS